MPGTLTLHMRPASAHGTATSVVASSAAKTIFRIGRTERHFLSENMRKNNKDKNIRKRKMFFEEGGREEPNISYKFLTLQAQARRIRRRRFTRRASKAAIAATGLAGTASDHARDTRRVAITRYGGASVGAATRNRRIHTKRPPRPWCPPLLLQLRRARHWPAASRLRPRRRPVRLHPVGAPPSWGLACTCTAWGWGGLGAGMGDRRCGRRSA